MSQTYSLLRSRTFLMLLLTFVVSVGNMLVPVLPAGVQEAATTVLLMLASVYHLSTAQTAGATN